MTSKVSPIRVMKNETNENEEIRIKEYRESQINTKKIEEHEKKQKDLIEAV